MKLTKMCLAQVEAVREYNWRQAGFQASKRTFSYFLSGHHGDRIVAVTRKPLPAITAVRVEWMPRLRISCFVFSEASDALFASSRGRQTEDGGAPQPGETNEQVL